MHPITALGEGMERRSKKRKTVNGDVEGGIIFIEPAEVYDISLSGIRFKSRRKLDPNTQQKIAIRHNTTLLQLRGIVVRSSIANSRKIEGVPVAIYEIALNFNPMPPEKLEILKALFLHL